MGDKPTGIMREISVITVGFGSQMCLNLMRLEVSWLNVIMVILYIWQLEMDYFI